MTVSVLFVFRRKRAERLNLYKAGLGPDEMLYGLPHLNPNIFNTSFIEDDGCLGLTGKIWSPVGKKIARRLKMGFSLDLVVKNLKSLRQADIIISTVDSWGLPLAMFKYVGLLKSPVIYLSQGLSDRIAALPRQSYTHLIIHKLYGRFLNAVEQIITLGAGAAHHFTEIFLKVSTPVSYVPFGIDDKFWHPAIDKTTNNYILSVGSDRARDYETLLEAVGYRQKLKIVTRLLPATVIGDNVEIASNYSDVELRTLYQKAKFVITPLKDVAQPSGQSATLQAMACGKAVILTKTQGLWEPNIMQHLKNCYLVNPQDIDGMRRAIAYLLDNPAEAAKIGQNARSTVETRYNSRFFAAKLQDYVETLCQTL